MEVLRKPDIVAGLRSLGLQPGDRVLVHSSMAALGKVDGGADTVIDALVEAVGPEGLVVVPTFACEAPFDPKSSATPLGAVPDRLWRRPEAVRSKHPTHSVAAIGKGAEELVRDHEKAPTAYAEGTPYHTLASTGGKILLMGVDQDRNTTLHTAEALAHSPYLVDIQATYIEDGREVTIPVAAMAGPHRDFIGLDPLFRELGAMRIGRIGTAVCRLIEAGAMLEAAIEALEADPAAVLCDNPACADCVMQRGKIKAARLAREDFTLAAIAGDISEDPEEIVRALQAEGINAVEITPHDFETFGDELREAGIRIVAVESAPDDERGANLAAEIGVAWIVPVSTTRDIDHAMALRAKTGAQLLIENDGAPSAFYEELYRGRENPPGLAFNPGGFARADEKPFLGVFYKSTLRKHAKHFYIDDYSILDGEPALPGQGNGEVKEIISMLRCRGYDGLLTLRSADEGVPAFRETARAFWKLLDEM